MPAGTEVRSRLRGSPAAALLCLASVMAASAAVWPAAAGDGGCGPAPAAGIAPAARDAYLQGQLAARLQLNSALGGLPLAATVRDGEARLSGEVESGVEHELVLEITRSVAGIRGLHSDIRIRPGARAEQATGRGLARRLDDALLTAQVKSRLILHPDTGGLGINVDTEQATVSLEGIVASPAERALAEQLALNTEGVSRVVNLLKVAQTARQASLAPAAIPGAY